MEHSNCGILAMVFGIIGALCLGKWFAVVPIALAIIFAMVGVSDPLKYRWPAIVGGVCAVVGIVFCGGRLILAEGNSTSTVNSTVSTPVQTASVQSSLPSSSINQTDGWSDYSVFSIDVRNISFPDDYGVMTASQTVNENVFQSGDLLAQAKDYISTGSGLVALSPDYEYWYDYTSFEAEDYRDFSMMSETEKQDYLGFVEQGYVNNNYSVQNKYSTVFGDVEYVVYTGTYNNKNGEPRVFYDYFSNVNGRLYVLDISSRDMTATSPTQIQNKIVESVQYYSSNAPQTNTQIAQTQTYSEPSDGAYHIGDTWTVPGQWSFTITSVEETSYRNQFSEKTPASVYYIHFKYENLGYEDRNGIMDGLFFDVGGGTIVDSSGQMGYEYPGDYPDPAQETPIGAWCQATDCIGVAHSGDFTLTLSKYDGNGDSQTATFTVNVN